MHPNARRLFIERRKRYRFTPPEPAIGQQVNKSLMMRKRAFAMTPAL
jgi:hypothetical protein